MKKLILAAIGFIMMTTYCTSVVYAEDSDLSLLSEKRLTSTVTMTSDYLIDGISYSDGDPALQADFMYKLPYNFYTGLFASSYDGGQNDVELGTYAGFSSAHGPVDYDFNVTYWMYPDAEDDDGEWDYVETYVKIGYRVDALPLEPKFSLLYLYTPENSGESGVKEKFKGAVRLNLPKQIGLGLSLSHKNYKDLGYDFFCTSISLSKPLLGFSTSLGYHINSESDFLESLGKDADPRFVLTISKSL